MRNITALQNRSPKILKVIRRAGFLAVIVLSLLALAACGGKPSTPAVVQPQSTEAPAAAATSAPTPAATEAPLPTEAPTATLEPTLPPTTAPAVQSGDPKQALMNVFQAVLNGPPYHITSTSTSDNGTSVDMVGEVILPDRIHVTSNGQEMLVVGNQAWMKQGDAWATFPVDIGSILSGITGNMDANMQNNISDVQILGPDTINGTPTTVYQYTSTADLSGQTVTSTVKMWVSVESGLPIHMEIDGEFAGIKSKTIQDLTYDPSIKIEAPAQ